MDTNKIILTDEYVRGVIAGWEASKPLEPETPEPLFVWPDTPGFRYLWRVMIYTIKMRRSGWQQFHDAYRDWNGTVHNHFHDIQRDAGSEDWWENPLLRELWSYTTTNQRRLRMNTMSQADWNEFKHAYR